MAELVLLTPTATLGGQAITDYIRSATLTYEADAVEFTASGDGSRAFLPGLKQWSVTFELNQDYAVGALDDDLFALLGTTAALALKPTSGAISTSNPEYQGSVIVTSYSPVNGSIGDAAITPITLQGSGTLTRDVTP